MDPQSKFAFLRCDDYEEALVFERSIFDKDDELLEFSIVDSYIGSREYHGILGRFRRAWHAFFGKPVYYAGVSVTDKEQAINFLNECLSVLNSDTLDHRPEHHDTQG